MITFSSLLAGLINWPSTIAEFLALMIIVFMTLEFLSNDCPFETNIDVQQFKHATKVVIGGQQHQRNWTERFCTSVKYSINTKILYNFRRHKIDLRINKGTKAALSGCRQILSLIFAPQQSFISSRRAPGLELNIVVSQTQELAFGNTFLDQVSIDIDQANCLQKLTWSGPFADLPFHSSPKRSWELGATHPIVFHHLTELRLFETTLRPDTLVDILIRCPVLVVCEVHALHTIQTPRTINERGPPAVHHMHLAHLAISSNAGLHSLFHHVRLHALRSLYLRLSPAALRDPVDVIPKLELPWRIVTKFELNTPLDYVALVNLKQFLDREPSYWGRTHHLIDDREQWYSRL